MLGLSTADGFMSVKEGVDDMIKYLANEPSVGLYFVQQHAQASMPYLLDVKDKITEKIHEVSLHTEDVEDSIDVLRSMTEIGYPVAEEMIKDIKTSLLIISKCQPKKGLIQTPTWFHQTDSSNSNTPSVVGSSIKSGHQEDAGSYLSAVLNSAKLRTTGFRRPLLNQPSKVDQMVQPPSQSPLESATSARSSAEAEELPVSCSLEVDEKPLSPLASHGSYDFEELYPLEDYSKFKYEKEAKFEAWLQEPEGQGKFLEPGD